MDAHRTTAFLAAGVIALGLLSGCVTAEYREPKPGALALTAAWRDAEHLDVTVRNVGGSPVALSGMEMMQLTGPDGTMELVWNGMAPTLAPGESRAFDLHAMRMADGTMGMTMDHAMAGDHMPMPKGDYMFRMGDARVPVTLGG